MRRASSGSTTAFRNSTPSLRPPSAASSGSQRELSSGAAGAGPGAAQRRESLGIGGHLGPGQRFLTEARWSDETVIGRLQEYLAQAGTPGGGVGVRWQRLPQAGQEIGGSGPAVLRQAGQGGQLPGWDVPGLMGRALVDKRLAQELDLRPGPVCCRVCRRTGGTTGQRRSWPYAGAGPGVGLPQGEWVAGDDAFGMSPTFREGLAALR